MRMELIRELNIAIGIAVGMMCCGAASATTIINLNAGSDTASTETISLTAGVYSVGEIGTASGGAYSGWNGGSDTNNLWTDLYAIDICGGSCNTILSKSGDQGSSTAAAALASYQSSPTLTAYNLSSQVLTTVANPYTFTLNSTQNVIFSVPDYSSYSDNSGGLSLAVSKVSGTTPEPGSMFLMGLGFIAVGFAFRGRKSARDSQEAFSAVDQQSRGV